MNLQERQIINDEKFLPVRILKTGDITVTYEYGRLRYIQYQGFEMIRMIFAAMRDEHWTTIPYNISDEMINEHEHGFNISFHASFKNPLIQFEADFNLSASDEGIVVFEMNGKSLTKFKSKRTGACIHHAIHPSTGRTVEIIQPNGKKKESVFPVLISAERPFTDVIGMRWKDVNGINVQLDFEGDEFETEDQRNWGDDSFKTYSGPQYKVPMLQFNEGDTMHHKITVRMRRDEDLPIAPPERIEKHQAIFPEIGYVINDLNEKLINKLNKIPHGHLLAEIKLSDKEWQNNLGKAAAFARKSGSKLRLHVLFSSFSEEEIRSVENILKTTAEPVASILILSEKDATAPLEKYKAAYQYFKNTLPSIEIGFGSNSWFANVNLVMSQDIPCDFIGFLLLPQVHQTDHRSILENLLSQHTILETINQKSGPKPVHIHLKFGRIPDRRLHTRFAVWWTLNALANLADAGVLTFYNLTGEEGVIAENETLYNIFNLLKDIEPLNIASEKPAIAQDPMAAIRNTKIYLKNGKGGETCFTIKDI